MCFSFCQRSFRSELCNFNGMVLVMFSQVFEFLLYTWFVVYKFTIGVQLLADIDFLTTI